MQITSPNNSAFNQYIPQKSEGTTLNKNESNGPNLKSSTNIIYKITEQNIYKSSSSEELISKTDFRALSNSIENLEKLYKEKGSNVDVAAIVEVDGQVMGYLNHDGSFSGKSGIETILSESKGDPQSLKRLVEEKYPSNGSVEVFSLGKGPTNAEVFELYNNKSYKSFVSNEINTLKDAQASEQQSIDNFMRRKLFFEEAPQTSVFKIGDDVVGSMDESGFLDIGQRLMKVADERNISRDQLKPLYSLNFEHTSADYKGMLTNIFGSDVKVENFEALGAPTRSEVRTMTNP
ncbi:hypothetical protein NQU47_00920 [Pseudoalteromonas distincta]|uniref:hypothetical protein n=1 Tax=Pseudoalteromonas distincta TaxID=77608 RepID=UPI0023413F3A|nr:hypothetical protein [Pseudoalteromonas distincta]MDC3211113.1 hypothetical protein [Pseudoalteromonas distincta]